MARFGRLPGLPDEGLLESALFLEVNGLRLTAPGEEAVAQTLALAAGEIDEPLYTARLKNRSVGTK